MGVGDDHDLALRRRCSGGAAASIRASRPSSSAKLTQVRVRHRLLAPSVGQAFEAALLADGIVAFLMPVAGLRHDVAIALGDGEALRDERSAGAYRKAPGAIR